MNQPSGNPFQPGFGAKPEPTSDTKPNPAFSPAAVADPSVAIEIVTIKELRRDLDIQLQKLKGMKLTHERLLSTTKIQEAVMWLGMSLKEINDTRPYPSSYDPSTTKIEPTADGLKL